MSLRRLKYQLRCATAGHDARPYLVGGTMVEQRCLRCGALVGDATPAVSTEHGPATPVGDALGPRPSDLPAAPETTPNGTAEGEEDGETIPALQALRELADLHAAGVLTDGEFAAKKAELLRRV